MLKKIIESGSTVFSAEDLAKILQIENRKYLALVIYRMAKRNEIRRIKKGLYVFQDRYDPLELANKLKRPSYVSFEYVLFKKGIIFQDFSNIITSASNNTLIFSLNRKTFKYFKLKDEILTNPIGIERENNAIVAVPERAICDTIYLRGNIYFDNLNSINEELFLKIAKNYNKRVLNYAKKLCLK
jgi:cell division protein YceG involved in septum cleavage